MDNIIRWWLGSVRVFKQCATKVKSIYCGILLEIIDQAVTKDFVIDFVGVEIEEQWGKDPLFKKIFLSFSLLLFFTIFETRLLTNIVN